MWLGSEDVDNVHSAIEAYLLTHGVRPDKIQAPEEIHCAAGGHVGRTEDEPLEMLFGLPIVVDPTRPPGVLELRHKDRPRAYYSLPDRRFTLERLATMTRDQLLRERGFPTDERSATVQTLEELEKAGYTVRIVHMRHWRDHEGYVSVLTREQARRLSESHLVLMPKGGMTTVVIVDGKNPDGHPIIGQATCSRLDNFNRRRGTTIALGRAVKSLHGR